jgi:Secretion system C-terminal sorting domain
VAFLTKVKSVNKFAKFVQLKICETMKKKYLWIALLLSTLASNSQVFVSSNSFVYVNDQYLYVKQDVELNAGTSNIYLRNNSQLLQGTTGVSTNRGLGALSVFQEGTVNDYQYNYWCSPVGGSSAVAGNSPFGITQLGVPTTITATTAATILPMNSYNGLATVGAVSIAPYWIWKFITSNAYSQWVQVGSASTLNAGEGFTMKGTSGTDTTTIIGVQNNAGSAQRYDFRGKPNDGNISIAVTTGNRTLTGNPFPSAIDLNLFLNDPSNVTLIDGTALFWEHDKTVNSHYLASYRGGYGVYNGSTGIYSPATFYTYDGAGNQVGTYSTPGNVYQRRFSPVGQGFKVRGIGNGNVLLKNTHRVFVKEAIINNSQFERNAITSSSDFYDAIPNVAGIDYTQISKLPTPHIKINTLLNNQAVRQVALCFMNTAIDGVDRADSKSPDVDANLPFDMYFFLGNTEYVQSTTAFDIDKRFPVGFKNNAPALFTIQVAGFENFNQTEEVYLFDKETGLYHDIKNAPYEVSITASGIHNNRYEIAFKRETLGVDDMIGDNFTVYHNNDLNVLVIKNPNGLTLKSCTLYDVTGKAVLTQVGVGSKDNYQISTANLAEGVYIVKLITDNNQEVSKKVSIY